ncbi:LysR family transcriptional regulator [Phytopseudomonas dryadis]|uniref:LysR family transcriptional regulator n=1 Tax=Phytopseudomonas dryadis TaxID=2487520 RepID=A0A4Q9QXV5_9GAMM|nr:LysR family transcriptional regulator [Pseudomonas dryadis]TBU89969.1 LysR family transcriptional regulator [Pseudomonas dryadis]
MLDRLTSMAVFVRAAEAGSFAAVAESLGMTPQMVAKHVAALERQLGTRLIQRTTRRQSLTEFGRLYLERCHAILAEVEAADTLAQTAQAEPRGRLRLNAPVTFGRYGLMPLVVGFLHACPAVEVDVVLSDRLVDLVDEGFEAVLRIGALDPQLALVARPLQPYRLLACASPDYLARHGSPSEPVDLAGHECVGFSAWPSAFSRQWHFVRAGAEYSVAVASRLNLSDWGAMHAAALNGYGIVLGYERALSEDLAAGRLVRVLADYDVPARPMHLLYAADHRMTPKLRAFVDWMLRAIGLDAPAIDA